MKKLLTILLSAVMVMAMMPAMAWADVNAVDEPITVSLTKNGEDQGSSMTFEDALGIINAEENSTDSFVLTLPEGEFGTSAGSTAFKILNPNVTIIGAGSDKTKINVGPTSYSSQAGFLILADNVTIEHLAIVSSHSSSALKVSKIEGTNGLELVNNVKISDVVINATAGNGLNLHGVEGATIDNLTVTQAGKACVAIAKTTNATFTNLNVSNSGWNAAVAYNYADGDAYSTASKVTFVNPNFNDLSVYSTRPDGTDEITITGTDKNWVKIVTEKGWGLVDADTNEDVVAEVNGVGYTTLQSAIDAADENGTVELLKDVTTTAKITVEKDITLNGNNHTVTANFDGNHIIGVKGNVTINDIVFDSSEKAKGMNLYVKGAEDIVNLNNVKSNNSVGSGLTVNGVTANITNCSFVNNAWQDVNVDKGAGVEPGATLNIKTGCTFGSAIQIASDGQIGNPETYGIVVLNDDTKVLTLDDTQAKHIWTVTNKPTEPPTPPTPPYIPPTGGGTAPKDPVTNTGTADTDNATTNADISKDTTSKTETTTETKPDGTTSTTTTVEVSDKTAAAIVDKAVEHQSAEVVVDVTKAPLAAAPAEGDKTEVKLPADTIQTLAEKTTADVTIKSDVAEVTMDAKAVEAVAEQIAETKAETVTLVVENTKNEAEEMHFELNLVTESGKVHEFNGGNVSVTVKLNKTLQAAEKLVCVYIDDNGVISKVEGYKNADGTFTFITGHFSTYAIMAEDEADKLIEEQTNARLKAGVENTTIKLKSALDGKGIKLSWTKSKGYKVDYYEVYKSTKKANGYGTKPYYKTKDASKTWYKNTKELKKGVRYYYKVRGVREIGGKTVYTKYSTKAWRLVK